MKVEEIFRIHIKIDTTISMKNSNADSVCMIQFSGDVTGKYFQGKVLSGGIDTQIINKTKKIHTLSARYMLEGKDYQGKECKVFIENNGDATKKYDNILFKTYPKIITNSIALKFLNEAFLIAEAINTQKGLDIIIYKKHNY